MLTSNSVNVNVSCLCNSMTVCKHLDLSLHIRLLLLKTVRGEGCWQGHRGLRGDIRSVCSTAAGGSQPLQLAPVTLKAALEEDLPPPIISLQLKIPTKRREGKQKTKKSSKGPGGNFSALGTGGIILNTVFLPAHSVWLNRTLLKLTGATERSSSHGCKWAGWSQIRRTITNEQEGLSRHLQSGSVACLGRLSTTGSIQNIKCIQFLSALWFASLLLFMNSG